MPLYEFKCQSCHAQFEMLVSRSQENFECPHCDSIMVEKQLSTFGVSMSAPASDPCMGGSCGMPEPGARCGKSGCPLN